MAALWTQPQIIGEMDTAGRPRPSTASVEPSADPRRLRSSWPSARASSPGAWRRAASRSSAAATLDANTSTQIPDMEGVFAGGDCVTGPATVIRAIAAGKAAAANIDEYLGFNHEIKVDVTVPAAWRERIRPRGRVNCQ